MTQWPPGNEPLRMLEVSITKPKSQATGSGQISDEVKQVDG